jgi:DNA-binding NtrC family response regulator
MIDWNRLISDPVLRNLGALLREQFGVWVGVVDPYGESYAIGDEGPEGDGAGGAPPEKPACMRFRSRAVAARDFEEPQTCAQSLRRWNEQAGGGAEAVETNCHAGFSAMLFGLDVASSAGSDAGGDGNLRACLYVSGYVHSELAYESLGQIRATFDDNGLGDGTAEATEAAMDAVPKLDRREREFMGRIAAKIAARCRLLLGATGESGAEVRVPGENFYGMVGASRPVRALFEEISQVARSNSTILIQGENGTGKELIARALHAESPRRERPFVAMNCAAVAGDLIASELFGHRRGAFSGAHRDRVGLVEEADGGTLFLDEIGDMELHLQVKLLRFLQEGTFMPVGDSTQRKVDVRVLCATNQDLEALVRQGTFRKDLFFRVNVINLVSPPLRRRRGDIEVLAGHFLSRASRRHQRPLKRLSEECAERLREHDWPGNVRELENEIERLVIMSGDAETIGAELLSERICPSRREPGFAGFEDMEMPEAVEKLERAMILETLRETGWNKTEAARILGVSRRNLIRKVSHFELERFREN